MNNEALRPYFKNRQPEEMVDILHLYRAMFYFTPDSPDLRGIALLTLVPVTEMKAADLARWLGIPYEQ